MSDDVSKKEQQVNEATPVEPAKPEKAEPKEEKKVKAESKKEKKVSQKKPSLSQKEIDTLILENADLKAEATENRNNFLLLAAEFENFKKRINKDQVRTKELYKEKILVEILPIIDDIDRGLKHHKDDEASEAFKMVKGKLIAFLESYNIVAFESLGEEFDPEKHDAMLTRCVEDEKDNIILEEFEKGYMIDKKVLRHAKVIVNIIE
jgi:molecular chaperone GrpE